VTLRSGVVIVVPFVVYHIPGQIQILQYLITGKRFKQRRLVYFSYLSEASVVYTIAYSLDGGII